MVNLVGRYYPGGMFYSATAFAFQDQNIGEVAPLIHFQRIPMCLNSEGTTFILIPKSPVLSQRTHIVIIPPGSPMAMANDIKSSCWPRSLRYSYRTRLLTPSIS